MKHLFSEAWSEDNNDSSNNDSIKDGYCKISSDVLKARLPEAIRITIQREKLKYNKKTRLSRQRQQQQQKKEEENHSPRVKSLKDFVQLFKQKRERGQESENYVSY